MLKKGDFFAVDMKSTDKRIFICDAVDKEAGTILARRFIPLDASFRYPENIDYHERLTPLNEEMTAEINNQIAKSTNIFSKFFRLGWWESK